MTPQRVVDAVYEALAAADWVLGRLGIRYVIMAGTLLGAIRPGGMIPWDDDADLGVCFRDEAAVRAAQPLLRSYGHDIAGFDHGLKIFPLSGSVLEPGLRYRYPFVDIFTLVPVSRTWVFSSAVTREKWPTEYFAAEDFDDLVRVPFGPLSRLGFEVIPVPFWEVAPFGGGLHCATADIERDGSLEDYFPSRYARF